MDDVESLPFVTFPGNHFALFERDNRERRRNLGQSPIIQILEELHLGEQFLRLVVVLHGVRHDDPTEGLLSDTEESAARQGETGSRTGTIVKKGNLSKCIAGRGFTDGLPVDNVLNFTLLQDVKVISDVTLLDDHFAFKRLHRLKGIDERVSLL